MKKRDIDIVKAIEKFRCLSRDDIVDMFFKDLSHPENSANGVLKRLLKEGQIDVLKNYRPYVYVPKPQIEKLNNNKIRKYLFLASIYRELSKEMEVTKFLIDPKWSNRKINPNAIVQLKNKLFFLDLAEPNYYQKAKAYENYYRSNQWKEDFAKFPAIVIISFFNVDIDSDIIHPIQVADTQELLSILNRQGES